MAAKGEYCAFLDDDDYWLPEKTEEQVRLLESKNCELVHCGRKMEIVSKDGLTFRDLLPSPLHCGDMHKKILLTFGCNSTTCFLIKRSALLEVGLFDEKLKCWQDYELTIRLAQRRPFYFVNKPLSVYRENIADCNRPTNKYYEWRDAFMYIREKHKNLYSKLNVIERINIWILYSGDSALRCKNSGLKVKAIMLNTLWLTIGTPFRIVWRLQKSAASAKIE